MASVGAPWDSTMGLSLRKNIRLFGRTRALESQIDTFLSQLSQSGLSFKLAVERYLDDGACDEFERHLRDVKSLESENDRLRRSIEAELYTHTLIPESRGDVLGLLENLDKVHGLLEGGLWQFSIEKPVIPESLKAQFENLCDASVNALESVVVAARAFFRNVDAVGDHLHKVMFFEKEADKIGTQLKRNIFASDLPLYEKIHLRDFTEHLDNVADSSEDVADRLAIYVIKRSI